MDLLHRARGIKHIHPLRVDASDLQKPGPYPLVKINGLGLKVVDRFRAAPPLPGAAEPFSHRQV